MAEKIAAVEKFLTCHVCLETFRDPVSLSCNHSFCSSCLKQFWEKAGNQNCPICQRKSSKDDPGVNFALKELADSFAGRQKSGSSEGEERDKEEELVCREHQEEPRLFCVQEQRALCTVCHFPHDSSHRVIPVEAAVKDLKETLRCDFKSLQDKREKYQQLQQTYRDVVQESKKQLESTERQIRAQFNKLHQFLREEEESRLAAVREEEEQRAERVSREMKRMEEQISSLSDCMAAVEAELQKASGAFLSSSRDAQSRARAQCSLSDPQLPSGLLIDVAKHLGNLSFSVWSKMKDLVHFTPLILDPNTAAGWLHLSDDLTSVRRGDSRQQLPDNPERFTKYRDVLGSEGFSSGKHSWEVEVGDLPVWTVGLAKESVDRRGERSASPEYGIWCLWHGDGKYINGSGQSVIVKESLQRIRVQLDYDRGEVSFYDSGDLSHICTHKDTFTEKLFPYFSVGPSAGAKTTTLTVCQAEITL
ncbi:nuclear factor 7, brain-like [Salarias fasciatus]|uniref:Nuclear factor 7, brain-like n=1 Tax=Salarias fasciatus TaxID=181472 RepID=A0A672I5F4_SALFA|nr:nuclear factor 7, brain-like [Salarias fasciatus]